MEILASSIQKTGDIFLHTGYMSAAAQYEPLGVGIMMFAGILGLCAFLIVNSLITKPSSKLIFYVITIFGIFLLFSG